MSLFQRSGSPAPSESADVRADENTPVGRRQQSAAGKPQVGGQAGITEREAASTVLRGRGPVLSTRKFKYDVVRGRGSALNFTVTRDDRMSDEQARDALDRLHRIYGVTGESDGFLFPWDQALFFCYTLNSGSTLTPGRATFSVDGAVEFEYSITRDTLGVDLRRFGRAFADEIRAANRRVMDEFDPYNENAAQKYYQLQQAAQSRGTFRAMDLTHDSAICCTGLAPHEYALVTAAANMVISSNTNSADRMKNNTRVQSAEKYDSTTGDVLGSLSGAPAHAG